MDRRRQLLQTALVLFNERGVGGASMRELAQRAGVTVAATYHHFESKRALLRAVFEELGSMEDIRARIEPEVLALLRTVPAADAVALILQLCWSRMEANAAYYSLLHAEVLRGDADARAVSMEMWQGWGEQLQDIVVGAGLGDDTADFASLLRSLLWGLFNESRLTGNVDEDYRATRSRQVATLLASAIPARTREAPVNAEPGTTAPGRTRSKAPVKRQRGSRPTTATVT
ncbi:MAG: TetR/AcrR family transcriptional regulator [Acidimicrobiales bacterium]